MDIKRKDVGEVIVFQVIGEIMGGNDSDAFKTAIYDVVQAGQTNIVADLSRATWMNSSGLGLLITGLTTLRSSGGDLRLANLSERIRRPMVITRLDSVFQNYSSVEEAIASYSE